MKENRDYCVLDLMIMELHLLYGSITITHLEEKFIKVITIPMLKIKRKTCMVNKPSHVKQLSLNHVCKIGMIVFLDFMITKLNPLRR
jgi:hypothetical protein